MGVFDAIKSGKVTRLQMQRMIDSESSKFGYRMQEIPSQDHVVNDANMRHLWILEEEPKWMWKNGK